MAGGGEHPISPPGISSETKGLAVHRQRPTISVASIRVPRILSLTLAFLSIVSCSSGFVKHGGFAFGSNRMSGGMCWWWEERDAISAKQSIGAGLKVCEIGCTHMARHKDCQGANFDIEAHL